MLNQVLLIIITLVCSLSSFAFDNVFDFRNSGELKSVFDCEENYFNDFEFFKSPQDPIKTEIKTEKSDTIPTQITINNNYTINYITNINNTYIYPYPDYRSNYPQLEYNPYNFNFANNNNNFSQKQSEKTQSSTETEETEETEEREASDESEIIGTEIPPREKLGRSKNPVQSALLRCVENNDGARFKDRKNIKIQVTDFETLLDCIEETCSKANPTTNKVSRIKSLQVHFTGFPPKRRLELWEKGFVIWPKNISSYRTKIFNQLAY